MLLDFTNEFIDSLAHGRVTGLGFCIPLGRAIPHKKVGNGLLAKGNARRSAKSRSVIWFWCLSAVGDQAEPANNLIGFDCAQGFRPKFMVLGMLNSKFPIHELAKDRMVLFEEGFASFGHGFGDHKQ